MRYSLSPATFARPPLVGRLSCLPLHRLCLAHCLREPGDTLLIGSARHFGVLHPARCPRWSWCSLYRAIFGLRDSSACSTHTLVSSIMARQVKKLYWRSTTFATKGVLMLCYAVLRMSKLLVAPVAWDAPRPHDLQQFYCEHPLLRAPTWALRGMSPVCLLSCAPVILFVHARAVPLGVPVRVMGPNRVPNDHCFSLRGDSLRKLCYAPLGSLPGDKVQRRQPARSHVMSVVKARRIPDKP